jgi:hypothetical protein
MATGYTEAELIANRTSVLLWGGNEDARAEWAEEAASHFAADGPLRVVVAEGALESALREPRGVVYIPSASGLSHAGQLALVRCLREQEERPKVILGLAGTQSQAVEKGLLRPDLDFALSLGRVDLAAAEVREAVKARRGKASKRPTASAGKRLERRSGSSVAKAKRRR